MEITIKHQGKQDCLIVDGDIDERGAEVLHKRFLELDRAALNELVLDFRKVKYIGSSGIGQLILFYKALAPAGKTIRIENPSKEVYDLLLDLDIHKVIAISKPA